MNETDAKKLENYLERVEAYDGGLAPEVERLVEALQAWPHKDELQPRAGFVNEVAGELHQLAERSAKRSWPSRILAGAIGTAALVLFGLMVISLFSRPGVNTAGTGMDTSAPAGAAEARGRTVTGQIVMGYGDRQPVAGATLQLEPGGEVMAVTQKDGRFTLTGIPFAASTVYAVHLQFVIPAGEEEHLELGTLEYPLVHPPVLPLADYPPRDSPYLVEGGDFWLVHDPHGSLLAFVPVSPAYREDVMVAACRFTWDDAVWRFIDPCSGDEWELDGTLNLVHSTERWSNRDLDQYAITIGEATVTVHLDQVITGTAREDAPRAPSATPTRPTRLDVYPGIILTLQDVSSTQYEVEVSLRIAIDEDTAPGEATGASLTHPTLVDEQGNQYEARIGAANSQATVDGLVTDVTQSFQPGALGARTLSLETGVELRAEATSTITLDLRGRQPGDRWPVDHTVEFYGLTVPIVAAALVTDPGASPGALALQLVAPCVSEAGVELIYLELRAEGATRLRDGTGGNSCGDGQARMVSTLTIEALLDGSSPAEMETVVLQVAGRLHLPGPWALTWEDDD